MKKILLSLFFLGLTSIQSKAQETQNETESATLKHYMPLYIDIPAELNVQKGFQEFDVAFGYADFKDFSGYRTLVEYDFAPIDRLGIEIELPFAFVDSKIHTEENAETSVIQPEEGGAVQSSMGLRIGFNYSFLILPEAKTTISAGYFNELESSPFKEFGKPLFAANIYYPFLAAAKVWGKRFHTMVYTGPSIKQEFELNESETQWKLNTTLSYRFGENEKENFAGFECNQSFSNDGSPQIMLRPQVQLAFSEEWSLGIVGTIPVQTDNGLNGSGFLRLMYLPRSKK
ncbi:HAEPLYID family protein [uncultured Flavobacterium sp.]|uniref:HAEPLYID family protein n=1 Tax=uncultured Flavobacterium sp. TaxID=165435 RepID=UPI0025E11F6F|nr:HAEPLYID family protein [uncultured Flavobacterium sp.]